MPKTGSGRNSTSTDHRLQIEKPMCSLKTEKKRLRRATPFPVDSQNSGSSGRQSSIHLPARAGTSDCGGVARDWVGAAMPERWPLLVSPASPRWCSRVPFRSPAVPRCGEAAATGVHDRRPAGDDHPVTAAEETAELPGRTLIERGAPVGGSMSRAAATVVFEPSAAKVTISASFAASLRTVATDAAALPVPREQVR